MKAAQHRITASGAVFKTYLVKHTSPRDPLPPPVLFRPAHGPADHRGAEIQLPRHIGCGHHVPPDQRIAQHRPRPRNIVLLGRCRQPSNINVELSGDFLSQYPEFKTIRTAFRTSTQFLVGMRKHLQDKVGAAENALITLDPLPQGTPVPNEIEVTTALPWFLHSS